MAGVLEYQHSTPLHVGITGVCAAALGASRRALAPAVHDLHCVGRQVLAEGRFTVRRGPGLFVALVANGLRLPAAGNQVPLRLHIERSEHHETWQRHFGDTSCVLTTQRLYGSGRIEERVGPAWIVLEVRAHDGALHMRQIAAGIRLRRLRVPLPMWLCPQTTASAAPASSDEVAVAVRVALPHGRVLLTYSGLVKQVRR